MAEPRPGRAVSVRVGADRVTRHGEHLQVHTRRPMPDWEVRKYGSLGIDFRGTTYVTRALRPAAGGGVVYELEPWSRARHDALPRRITYDAEYVRARYGQRAAGHLGAAIHLPAKLLSPLLGFLPSAVKRRLHEPLGLDPRAATSASMVLEFVALILAGTAVTVLGFASVGGGIFGGAVGVADTALLLQDPIVWLLGLIVVLAADLLGRGGKLLRGELDQYGFYEWAVRPLLALARRGAGGG